MIQYLGETKGGWGLGVGGSQHWWGGTGVAQVCGVGVGRVFLVQLIFAVHVKTWRSSWRFFFK